jgi:hypothetical protein
VRVLGIEIAGSDSLLIVLAGTARDCQIEPIMPSRLPLPPDPEQVNRLVALKRQIYDVLKSTRVECIGVIRADAGCSPLRAKVESMIQIAAVDAAIPCMLVAPQTVAAAEKRKVNDCAGPDTQKALREISPRYLSKAAYCAWSVINGKQ